MIKKPPSTDATKKMLGYDYQKLIALENCFNAPKNGAIWLECKGDISDGSISTEVKHHLNETNLTSNAVDAWKTLNNYVEQKHITAQHTALVLHTTAQIPSNSIFHNWNELSPKKKYQRLKSHKPADSIKEYYDKVITDSDEAELTLILSKFTIDFLQPTINQKWEELKSHSILAIIPDRFKETALQKLYGYISQQAIKDNEEWRIDKNEFDRDLQQTLGQYTKDYVPFPVVTHTHIEDNLHYGYYFVSEMREIKLKDQDIANAVSDYLRAKLSQFQLLSEAPTLQNDLNIYDENIHRDLHDQKSSIAEEQGIEVIHINTDKALTASRKVYRESLRAQHHNIRGVEQTEKYYRDGRIHNIVEQKSFSWHYTENDL